MGWEVGGWFKSDGTYVYLWLIHGVGWDVLGMLQPPYIYCALYFYYDYISSISDHQALDPGGWGRPTLSHVRLLQPSGL